MPAFVNRRFGLSGMRDELGTIVWCFSRKKSRKDWRIWADVMVRRKKGTRHDDKRLLREDRATTGKKSFAPEKM
jgi:hypothetical protein